MFRQIEPCALNDFAELIQSHFAVYDFAKQTFALPDDNRNEIRA
jgi:hypothetical protein